MTPHVRTRALRAAPPFDFAHTCALLRSSGAMRGDHTLTDTSLTKALLVDDVPVAFRVGWSGTPEAPELAATLYAPQPITRAGEAAAHERIDFFLGLSDDLRPLYGLAQQDQEFLAVVHQLYGYHRLKLLSPFEAACWAVLTQHNHMSIAGAMRRALTRAFGRCMAVEGQEHWAFPGPLEIAAADPAYLHWLIKNERRAIYVQEVARAFMVADEPAMRTGDYQAAMAWLLSIPGIGPWSAGFVLNQGFGRTEGPLGIDSTLLRAAAEVYGSREVTTTEDVRRIAEDYGPHQTYWANYLRATSWLRRKAGGRLTEQRAKKRPST